MHTTSVFKRSKSFLLGLICFLLGLKIVLLALDPFSKPGLSFYQTYRVWINWLYYLTAWLEYPVLLLGSVISGWFPVFLDWLQNVPFKTILDWVLMQMPTKTTEVARLSDLLVGQLSVLSVVSIAFYSGVSVMADYIATGVSRLFWILFTEFSFANQKEKTLKQEIELKQAEISKLGHEYHHLSKVAVKLKDTVITDELTKIYNKRFFLDKMSEFFQKVRQNQGILSLIMIDIDHFKKLNDTYGHMFGDIVLKTVAQAAHTETPPNCFCCRFGGEELGIIMPAVASENSKSVAENIRKAIMALKFREQPNLVVTASFGVATVHFNSPKSRNIHQFDDFVKLADDELYKAKLAGRNTVSVTVIQ